MVLVMLGGILMIAPSGYLQAQDKTHSKKLEKTKVKKIKRKKDKKAAQFQGKIEPSATPTIKGNPTKKKKKGGATFQERSGAGKVPQGTKGTKFGGRDKPKAVGKSKGTRFGGDPVTPQEVKGNPTRKKRTSGRNYQESIGGNKAPAGTEGTNFSGRGRRKSVGNPKGTGYRGEKVPVETGVKGNPTKNTGNNPRKYQERMGNQGPPQGTDGTSFSGRRRPKKIPGGTQGTNYSGQSTAGSSSSAGGRTTIYGERGRNNKGGGVPQIEQQDQGSRWKGSLKGSKELNSGAGTTYSGNLKRSKKITNWDGADFSGDIKVKKSQTIRDYGGDWAGDLKLRKRKPDTRASTYAIKGYKAKQLDQGPGTTFKGHLRSSKKIVNWDGADFAGNLKVNPNKKTRTEGTKFAGHLKVRPNAKVKTEGTEFAGHYKVRPNAKVKTEGTEFAGHYKVRPNARIKTEGATFRGSDKVSTRFFTNRYYRKKSREEQLFAGNYRIRRNKGRDLHPSANYTGGPIKKSEQSEALTRKWKLFWAKTKKNDDQPQHLKNKGKKPKYDPKERDIWHD